MSPPGAIDSQYYNSEPQQGRRHGSAIPSDKPSSKSTSGGIITVFTKHKPRHNRRDNSSPISDKSAPASPLFSPLQDDISLALICEKPNPYSPENPPPSLLSTSPKATTIEMPFRQRVARHFGEQLSPEKAYLSYHDVLLTYEDMKALKNDWLTDMNIAFWEEWLEREILPKYPQANIVLLRPSMTFLMMKETDPMSIKEALPSFNKVTHIFLPVNDARSVTQAEGGSHWSLLLVSTIDGVAFHYDSLGGANYNEGRFAAQRLGQILGQHLKFQAIDDSPQQDNGRDCGVFVCILMRHLLVKKLLNANAREKVSMSMANKMIDANGGRKEMIKIIEMLRKEGERRRSASPYSKSHTPPRIE